MIGAENYSSCQTVPGERKFSTRGAKVYIPRQNERKIYFN